MSAASMADVSVVVPVYKVEKYIRPSIEALLAQTHKNIEIILVDDGSPDSSGKICDEFAARDSRVKVIHKKNGGTGFARQSGMDAASGEYIYFCDPDDITEPKLIEDNFALAKEKDADIIMFGYRVKKTDMEGNVISVSEKLPLLKGEYSYEEFWDNFEAAELGTPQLWASMFRLSFIKNNDISHHGFNTGQDKYFLCDIYGSQFNKIVYNPRPYYNYFLHSGSSVTTYKPERLENEYALWSRYEEVIKNSPCAQGKYDFLIQRMYVLGVSQSIGGITRGAIPFRDKTAAVKKAMSKENFARAVREIPLNRLKDPVVKLRVILLRMKMYRSVIWLGEIFNRLKGRRTKAA